MAAASKGLSRYSRTRASPSSGSDCRSCSPPAIPRRSLRSTRSSARAPPRPACPSSIYGTNSPTSTANTQRSGPTRKARSSNCVRPTAFISRKPDRARSRFSSRARSSGFMRSENRTRRKATSPAPKRRPRRRPPLRRRRRRVTFRPPAETPSPDKPPTLPADRADVGQVLPLTNVAAPRSDDLAHKDPKQPAAQDAVDRARRRRACLRQGRGAAGARRARGRFRLSGLRLRAARQPIKRRASSHRRKEAKYERNESRAYALFPRTSAGGRLQRGRKMRSSSCTVHDVSRRDGDGAAGPRRRSWISCAFRFRAGRAICAAGRGSAARKPSSRHDARARLRSDPCASGHGHDHHRRARAVSFSSRRTGLSLSRRRRTPRISLGMACARSAARRNGPTGVRRARC